MMMMHPLVKGRVLITQDHLEKTDAAFRALDAWRAWAEKLAGRKLSDEELRMGVERLLSTARKEQGKWT